MPAQPFQAIATEPRPKTRFSKQTDHPLRQPRDIGLIDEKPSFAPNSKLIVYATRLGGREALMTTTLDGKIKARLAGQAGDIREPDWGPFQKQ